MIKRELGIYSALLLGSLALAYWASLPVTESDADKVAIASVEPKSVTEVRYTAPDLEVTATRREGDDRYWVDYKKTEKVPEPKQDQPKDPHAPKPEIEGENVAAAEKPAEPKVTTDRFLSNDKMGELVGAFAPLQALRVIGKVDDKQLEEFGLKDKTSRVEVKAAGQTVALILGKKSYGSRNRFALEDGGQGRVILIDDQGIENLERANMRLYERRLVPFELDEVSKAEIDAGGKKKRLAHTQRDKNGELIWTDDEEGAQAKPSYGTWMDKVAKLRLSGFADQAQEQQLAQVAPFLEITLEKNGQPQDKISFRKLAGEGGKMDYFVTSGFLKTQAKIAGSRIEPIEKDVATITGS